MGKGSFKTTVMVADAVCLLLASLAAWRLQGVDGVIAAVVGNALGLGNLLVMSWLVSRVIGASSSGSKGAYAGLFAAKLTAFVGVMALLLWVFDLQPLGLLIGFTALVAAVLVAGFAASTETKRDVSLP